jgi:hypothetical protein
MAVNAGWEKGRVEIIRSGLGEGQFIFILLAKQDKESVKNYSIETIIRLTITEIIKKPERSSKRDF